MTHGSPPIFLCFTTQEEGLPRKKGCYSFVSHREGLVGSTHLLQLFDAGCMHYDLAGCTLTPGERFLLEDEKRDKKKKKG